MANSVKNASKFSRGKKPCHSDEESELGGCLTGWTNCLRQTVCAGWEEEPAPLGHHGETGDGDPNYGRDRHTETKTETEVGTDSERGEGGLLRRTRDKGSAQGRMELPRAYRQCMCTQPSGPQSQLQARSKADSFFPLTHPQAAQAGPEGGTRLGCRKGGWDGQL